MRWAVGILATLFFAGCSNAGRLDVVKDFENDEWRYADSVRVRYAPSSPSQPRNLILCYGLTEQYPFRNLTLKARTLAPNGAAAESMPVFVVSDAQGRWKTEKQWRGTYEFRDTVLKNVVFDPTGEYVFDFKQYHRTDTLKGVKFFRVIIQ